VAYASVAFERLDAKNFSLVAALPSVCLATHARPATSHRGRGHVRIPARETDCRRDGRLRHALPARVLLSASSLNGRKPEPMPCWISFDGPQSLRCPLLKQAGARFRPLQLRFLPHRARQDSAATMAGHSPGTTPRWFHREPLHECAALVLLHSSLPLPPCYRMLSIVDAKNPV
jgi:hypothetical protein